MGMRYVSVQQTIQLWICKISDIGYAPTFSTVIVSWYLHSVRVPCDVIVRCTTYYDDPRSHHETNALVCHQWAAYRGINTVHVVVSVFLQGRSGTAIYLTLAWWPSGLRCWQQLLGHISAQVCILGVTWRLFIRTFHFTLHFGWPVCL